MEESYVRLSVETLQMNKQALIFVSSKRSAQKTALDIAKSTKQHLSNPDDLRDLSDSLLSVLDTPTEQCKKLAQSVRGGCAFHHAGLAPKQKTLIEQAFRNGTLALIAATPTLAAGLDLPAFRTILRDVKRYAPPWGMQYIPVLEYLQMAGRAGRPGKETTGEAILLAKNVAQKEELKRVYIDGEVEPIHSKLAAEPVLRTYVLSLISTGICTTQDELTQFFKKTFWAHQYQDSNEVASIIRRVTRLLQDYSFLEKPQATNEFLSADELSEDLTLRATQLGVRVSQLYIDPYSANILIKGLTSEKEKTDFGVIQLLTNALEIRPLLRVKSKEVDAINTFLLTYEDKLLTKIPNLYDLEYDDFTDTIKTTKYFLDWINEISEATLLESYDIRPGEIAAKNERMDWLLYCAVELAKVLQIKPTQLQQLRVRMQFGVKAELLPLLQLKQIGKVRSRLLFSNGLRTIADIKQSDPVILKSLIGPKIAQTIYDQLGVEQSKLEGGQQRLN